MVEELLAVLVEVSHESYRVALLAAGVKRSRLPKSFHVPRPSTNNLRTAPAHPERRHAQDVSEVTAVLNAGHRPVRR